MLMVFSNSFGWGASLYRPACEINDASGDVVQDVTVDYIQRGAGQKWCGSGDVFISHATGHPYTKGSEVSQFYENVECTRTSTFQGAERMGSAEPFLPSPTAYMMAGGLAGDILYIARMNIVKQSSRWKCDGAAQGIILYPGWRMFSTPIVYNSGYWRDTNPGYDGLLSELLAALAEYRFNKPVSYYNGAWGLYFAPGGMTHRPTLLQEPMVKALDKWTFFHEFGTTGDGGSNSYFAEAYLKATENLPQLQTNNVANLIEAMRFLVDLAKLIKSGDPTVAADIARLGGNASAKEVIKVAGESWLAYRYQWSTTKADIEELGEYLSRTLNQYSEWVKTGASVSDNEGGVYSCTMSVRGDGVFPPNSLNDIAKSKYWQGRLGFNLDAANVWDLVPFSFIVDWALHIGDKLELLRTRELSFSLTVRDVWYSYRREWDYNNTHYRVYYRVNGTGRVLGVPTAGHDNVTKGLTVMKRVGDIGSLGATAAF